MDRRATRWSSLTLWALGGALCAVQFAARRSMWVDELAVAHNVLNRDVAALLREPLYFDQVAPPGFLVVQHFLASLITDPELGLRLYALLLALVTIAIVIRLGRVHQEGWFAAIAPLLFALSSQTPWLASQVKPYSGDACLSAALLLGALTVPRWRSRIACRVGMLSLGLAAPWFSMTALFTLPSLVLALVADDWRNKRRLSAETLLWVGAWGAGALAAIVVARSQVSPETLVFMRDFWRDSFPTFPPERFTDIKWPAYTIRQLVSHLTNGVGSYAYLLLTALGAWGLWRRSRLDAVAVLLPLLLALGAAAARQYPLTGRLGYFLLPSLALLVGLGAGEIGRVLTQRPIAAYLSFAVVAPPAVWLLLHPLPFAVEHTRPLLEVLKRDARAGDAIYVPYGAWQAWSFYAPRYGLDWLPVRMGTCHGRALAQYGREIGTLRSLGRTWILFVPAGELRNPAILTRTADLLGRRVASYRVETDDASGSARRVMLYLYDFGGRPVAPRVARTARLDRPSVPSDAECRGAAIPLGPQVSAHTVRSGP